MNFSNKFPGVKYPINFSMESPILLKNVTNKNTMVHPKVKWVKTFTQSDNG